MGFLNFLKPKGKKTGAEEPAASQQLPPLPSESEFYSELPTLPEAPEMPGLPEIDLPQPMKGMEDFELPDEPSMRQRPQMLPSNSPRAEKFKEEWMKSQDEKLPELPKMSTPEESKAKPWLNIPSEVPELKPFQQQPGEKEESHGLPGTGKLISRNNSFFLEAEDFRTIRSNLEKIAKGQKKHHILTELKKEEGDHYDHINSLTEEMQRKLMHIDRTLFD